MCGVLTNEQLEAIRKRAEAATEGATPEWYVDEDYKDTVRCSWSGDLIAQSIPTEADAEFIAHAREDVPALLSLVAQQQAEIERLKSVLTDFANYGTRHDIRPTIGGRIRSIDDALGWYEYIGGIDEYVRRKAKGALMNDITQA